MKQAIDIDLAGLKRSFPGGAGDPLGAIGLGRVSIGDEALADLTPAVLALVPPGSKVVVLADATPMRRGSDDLKALVRSILDATFSVRYEVLGADRPELHADELASAEADRAITGADCVVTVGSGTVTDLGKDATYRAGRIPLLVVQTAVSVNAFSDNMAVLVRNGVKRTMPSRWPDTLIVDLETIASAPPEMNAAGFGELISIYTAPADWYLAAALGMDEGFEPRVLEIFRDRAERFLEIGRDISERRHEGLAELARMMTVTGISMGVAGRTAPLSGMEHTISHMLDMSAEAFGQETGLHGAQVGVAAVIASATWDWMLREFDPARLGSESAYPARTTMKERVGAAFRDLDPTGRLPAECWRDYEKKLDRWDSCRPRIEPFIRDWPDHRAFIRSLVAPLEEIAGALSDAGAATRFRDLQPSIEPDRARWAVENCHLMRNRFTVVDLAFLAGLWQTSAVDRLLSTASLSGAGL
jgi:glycerol-1-phosphate dehydrogenase [NAD(P)+]